MNVNIDGVAFDLDGTLYPNYRHNIRLIPFILKEFPLLWAFGKARDVLRGKIPGKITTKMLPGEDFYDAQARHMGAFLKKDAAFIKEQTEQLIYQGWESLFKKIRPFPHVGETLKAIRSGGFKLGLLSDFPPEQKLEYLGFGGIWDVICCSERVGQLKPAPDSFEDLARRMGLKPERLLYVGNSLSYDILGAKKVGMKTALICHPFRGSLQGKGRDQAEHSSGTKGRGPIPDLVFHDYRQLGEYVLR